MAAVVWTDLTVRVPSLSTVNVSIQTDILTVVNQMFDPRLFDFGEADALLRLVRIYFALHLATGGADASGGAGASGPVTAESADGLSVSYGTLGSRDPALTESWWGRQFLGLARRKRHGPLVI